MGTQAVRGAKEVHVAHKEGKKMRISSNLVIWR